MLLQQLSVSFVFGREERKVMTDRLVFDSRSSKFSGDSRLVYIACSGRWNQGSTNGERVDQHDGIQRLLT